MAGTETDKLNGLTTSVAVKAPVKAASTGNLTLSGEQTVDGVALVTGDRVLVKSQTVGSENGIYDVDTGAWSRSLDFNGNRDVVFGTLVVVGIAGIGPMWQVTAADPISIGSTNITWIRAASPTVDYAALVGSGSVGYGASQVPNGAAVNTRLNTAENHAAAVNPHSGSASDASVTIVQNNLNTHKSSADHDSRYVDLTTSQDIGGQKTLTAPILSLDKGASGVQSIRKSGGGFFALWNMDLVDGRIELRPGADSGFAPFTMKHDGFGSFKRGIYFNDGTTSEQTDTTLVRSSAGDLTIEGNLIYRANGTDVPVIDGGTGSSSAGGARTNLGLGNVDNTSDANKPTSTATQTKLNAKADKGVNNDITELTGLTTALSIAQGGTGKGTAQEAIDALTQVALTTDEYVLTKHTASGKAEWKVNNGAPGAGQTNEGALLDAVNPNVYKQMDVNNDLEFRSVKGSGLVSVTENPNDITLSTTAEINTTSNDGSGSQIAKAKVGSDLPMRSILGGTGISASQGTNEITIAVDAAASEISNDSGVTGVGVDGALDTLDTAIVGINTELSAIGTVTNMSASNNQNTQLSTFSKASGFSFFAEKDKFYKIQSAITFLSISALCGVKIRFVEDASAFIGGLLTYEIVKSATGVTNETTIDDPNSGANTNLLGGQYHTFLISGIIQATGGTGGPYTIDLEFAQKVTTAVNLTLQKFSWMTAVKVS